MKKLLFALFAVTTLFAAGCSDDDNNNSNNNGDGNNSLVGTVWEAVESGTYETSTYRLTFKANGVATLYYEEIQNGERYSGTFTGGYIYNAPELTAEFEGEYYRATVMGNRFIAYDEYGDSYGPFIRK